MERDPATSGESRFFWRLILGIVSSLFLAYALAPGLNHFGLMVSGGLGPRNPRITPDDQMLLLLLTLLPGVVFSALLEAPPPAAMAFGIPYVIIGGGCSGALTAFLRGNAAEVLVWGGVPLWQILFILAADYGLRRARGRLNLSSTAKAPPADGTGVGGDE